MTGFTLKFWKWPGMGWSLLRALGSGWDIENVRQRLDICRACEHVQKKPTVDHRGIIGEHLYCKECECGDHSIAELSTKLGFDNVRCPLTPPKWGPVHVSTVKEGSMMLAQRQVKDWRQNHPQQAATNDMQVIDNWRQQNPGREADFQRMMGRYRKMYPEQAAKYDEQQAADSAESSVLSPQSSVAGDNGTAKKQPASLPERIVEQTMSPMHPGIARLADSSGLLAVSGESSATPPDADASESRITPDEPTARPPTISTDAPELLGAEQGGAQH